MSFTRALMAAAALVLGTIGVACLFAPDVVLTALAGATAPGAMLLVQILGTLALALAILDWMWKGNRLGGIYGRPIVLANVLHFVSTTLVVIKALPREPSLHAWWPLAAVYAALGAGFLVTLFRHPEVAQAQAARQ